MNSRVRRALALASKDDFSRTTVFGAAPQRKYLRRLLVFTSRTFLPGFLIAVSTWPTVAQTERLALQSEIEPSEVHKLGLSQQAILNDYE